MPPPIGFTSARVPLVNKAGTLEHLDTDGFQHVPAALGVPAGYVLASGGPGVRPAWTPLSGVSVASVFGRTGAVVANSADYAAYYQPLDAKLTAFVALANGSGVLTNNGSGVYSWVPAGGGGTVTSVALSAPSLFTVSGSPITAAGTLSFAWNGSSANLVRADGSTVAASTYATASSLANYLPLAAGVGNPLSGKLYGVDAQFSQYIYSSLNSTTVANYVGNTPAPSYWGVAGSTNTSDLIRFVKCSSTGVISGLNNIAALSGAFTNFVSFGNGIASVGPWAGTGPDYATIYGASVGTQTINNYGLAIHKTGTATYLNGTTSSALCVNSYLVAQATSAGLSITGSLTAFDVAGGSSGILKIAASGLFSVASSPSDFPILNQSTTGNAASANRWATPRTFTIGGSAQSVDGSGPITFTLGAIGALGVTAQAVDSARLGGQLPAYYAQASSLASYLPLAGGGLTGPVTLVSSADAGLSIRRAGSNTVYSGPYLELTHPSSPNYGALLQMSASGGLDIWCVPGTAPYQLAARLSNSGSLTLTGGLVGKTDASAAASGEVGEYITSALSASSPTSISTSGTAIDMTSISLPAGDWDVFATIVFSANVTGTTRARAAISTASATVTSDGYEADGTIATVSGGRLCMDMSKRINVSATTTVYLSAVMTGTFGAGACWGNISARRRR